jgi:pSer/pThr/pTyr-binding forkhead associated (FHA) protein
MVTTKVEDLNRDSLYTLLTVGYLKNRRRGDTEISPMPVVDGFTMENIEVLVDALGQKPILPSVVLTVESGPLKGGRFTVKPPCTIGRKNSDLILDDRFISRRHAELKIVENILTIEDLGSKNGTMVNGETVTKKRLITPNDLIFIGSTKLRVTPA